MTVSRMVSAVRAVDVQHRLGREARAAVARYIDTNPEWNRMAQALDALLEPPPGRGTAQLAGMADQILLALLTGYQRHLTEVLSAVDGRMTRILDDVNAIRHGDPISSTGVGQAGRSAEDRARDLRELSDALDSVETFQQHAARQLQRRAPAVAGILRENLERELGRGRPRPRVVSDLPDGVVDINAATVTELQALPGMTPAMAQAIVAHRRQHGPFYSVSELADVPGVNAQVVDNLDDSLHIGADAENQLAIFAETRRRAGPGTATGDSTALAAAMRANRPGSPQRGSGMHAHHIVPSREGGWILDDIREAIREATGSSHINVTENGAWLVGRQADFNPSGSVPHNTYLHAGYRMDYIYTVWRRLRGKTGPELLDALDQLRLEMEGNGPPFHIEPAPRWFQPDRVLEPVTPSNPVNLNSGNPFDLQRFDGIGDKLSARIVDELELGGDFRDLDDLVSRVSGIGPRTRDRLEGLVVFEEPMSMVPTTGLGSVDEVAPRFEPLSDIGYSPNLDGGGPDYGTSLSDPDVLAVPWAD